MDKKGVRSLRYFRYLLFFFVVAVTIIFLQEEPTLTGYLTGLPLSGEQALEKNWTFSDPEDYAYNATEINLSENLVTLLPQVTVNQWTTEEQEQLIPTSAILRDLEEDEAEDKTAAVQDRDGQFANLHKGDSVLDITFNTSLENGDSLSLYLLQSNNVEVDIRLCNQNTTCPVPGYGSVHFNEQEGWYSLILSGLSSPQDALAIDPPSHVKVDYVNVSHRRVVEHNSTNSTYPLSAAVETADLIIPELLRYASFIAQETLNGQIINYYYSVDSGTSWQPVPLDGNLSAADISPGKIRFKAVLRSNGTAAPFLSTMNLRYATAASCTPLLENTSWSPWSTVGECTLNDLQLQTRSAVQYDAAFCGAALNETFAEQQTVPCSYCGLHNCTASFEQTVAMSPESLTIDAQDKMGVLLQSFGTNISGSDAQNQTYYLVLYNWSDFASPAGRLPLGKYLNITADYAPGHPATLSMEYTDEEVASSTIDGNTLAVYYYNETLHEWTLLNSVVDRENDSVSAAVFHFSWYALFGAASPPAVGSSSSSSSSSGGGGSSQTTVAAEAPAASSATETTSASSLRTRSEPSLQEDLVPEEACDYVLEVSLPERISLIAADFYEGTISNKGDCAVQDLRLYVSPELGPFIEFSPLAVSELQVGNTTRFVVIRKKQQGSGLFSWLTGSAVAELATTDVAGAAILEVVDGETVLHTQRLPLEIRTLSSQKFVTTFLTILSGVIAMGLLVGIVLVLRRKARKVVRKKRR